MRRSKFPVLTAFCMGLMLTMALISIRAIAAKPNIVVIWSDDIGMTNVSAYSKSLMGYQTPYIDRIAIARLIVSFQSLMDLRLSTIEGGPQAR